MIESSFGQSIRLRIKRSGEMEEGDVGEGASQQLCFEFSAFHMARMEITLAIDPVNDDFGVTNDLEVVKRPSGCKKKGRPETQQFGLSIRAPSTAEKPFSSPLLMRSESSSRTTTMA